jgi:polyhydroxybutyrate depolymerase
MYEVKEPPNLDKTKPVPLMLLIHGFTPTDHPGDAMDMYMKVSPETAKRGILLAIPEGTYDKLLGRYSWNATDTCCGWDTMANDIGYVLAMVEDIQKKYNVDPKRIFILGHSNGGFMANRLGCDRSSIFSGIASLAGEVYKNPKKCAAVDPLAMLEVQGDADDTVPYAGGEPFGITGFPPAPGAQETGQIWAAKNGCMDTPDTTAPAVDLVTDLPGAETTKEIYKGCKANGEVQVWTIHGGPHSPAFNDTWAPTVIDFLMAHPKP